MRGNSRNGELKETTAIRRSTNYNANIRNIGRRTTERHTAPNTQLLDSAARSESERSHGSSANLIIHRVPEKRTDSILGVTSIHLDNLSQFLAQIILTGMRVTEKL